MAYCVIFKKKSNGTEVVFGVDWEAVERFNLTPSKVSKLGKQLIKLAQGKKKRIAVKLEKRRNGLTAYAERNVYKKRPVLSFRFDCTHYRFMIPCHNTFNYSGFDYKELEAFGVQLTGFHKSGYASIGDTNRRKMLFFEFE